MKTLKEVQQEIETWRDSERELSKQELKKGHKNLASEHSSIRSILTQVLIKLEEIKK